MAADNTSLGQFNLVGIPPAPRGIPQIEVTFDIDANGILNVSAKDLGTGREQKITITASTKLSKSEIDKMVKQAEEHAEEDRRRKEEIEIRNTADSLIYTTEKTINELGDKISKEQKDKVDEAVNKLKESLKGKDIQDIKQKTDELTKVIQQVGASVYQQFQQDAGKKQEKPSDDNVVDADYKVEDEDGKK